MGFSAVVEGLKRYDILRGASIVFALVNVILIYYLLSYANGLWLMVGASLTISLLTTLCYMIATIRLLPEYSLNPFLFKFGILKQLFNMGGKLIVSRIVGLIFNNTQKIMIATFLTMTVMTNFDIINKVHLIVLTIMSLMNQALIPFASHLDAAGDEERLRLLFVKATKYAAIMTLPALIFFSVMAGEFLGLWVGPEFASYAMLTRLYLSHVLLTVLTGVGSTMMVGMNRVRELLNISIIGAVLNLLITLATIRQWGIGGLVAGTVLAYVVCQVIFIGLFVKLFKIGLAGFIRQVVLGPYLLAGLFLLLTLAFKHWFTFTSLGQLFIFAVFLYATYLATYLLIDRGERELLWGLVWKR
jgi:O-antigen/teichoic acid export membrane protein